MHSIHVAMQVRSMAKHANEVLFALTQSNAPTKFLAFIVCTSLEDWLVQVRCLMLLATIATSSQWRTCRTP